MKKKNLGLKIATVLLSFGSFAAINSVSNSTFAMEMEPNYEALVNIDEEKEGLKKDIKALKYYYSYKNSKDSYYNYIYGHPYTTKARMNNGEYYVMSSELKSNMKRRRNDLTKDMKKRLKELDIYGENTQDVKYLLDKKERELNNLNQNLDQ